MASVVLRQMIATSSPSPVRPANHSAALGLARRRRWPAETYNRRPGARSNTTARTRAPLRHRDQRARGCGGIEVEIRPLLAVDAGDSQAVADQGDRRPSSGDTGHLRRLARRSPAATARGCCARCSAMPPPAARHPVSFHLPSAVESRCGRNGRRQTIVLALSPRQGHRPAGGMCPRTGAPQPFQVGRLHFRHLTASHIPHRVSGHRLIIQSLATRLGVASRQAASGAARLGAVDLASPGDPVELATLMMSLTGGTKRVPETVDEPSPTRLKCSRFRPARAPFWIGIHS